MDKLNHLISKHRILCAFTIARNISKKEMAMLKSKIKKKYKSSGSFDENLKKEIIEFSKKCIETNQIPGLILNGLDDVNVDNSATNPTKIEKSGDYHMSNKSNLFSEKNKKITILLHHFASGICKKFMDNALTKEQMCYIILNMLSMLHITNDDFKDFHKKNNPNHSDDADDSDDGFSPLP